MKAPSSAATGAWLAEGGSAARMAASAPVIARL
jgi:hypothetical protein